MRKCVAWAVGGGLGGPARRAVEGRGSAARCGGPSSCAPPTPGRQFWPGPCPCRPGAACADPQTKRELQGDKYAPGEGEEQEETEASKSPPSPEKALVRPDTPILSEGRQASCGRGSGRDGLPGTGAPAARTHRVPERSAPLRGLANGVPYRNTCQNLEQEQISPAEDAAGRRVSSRLIARRSKVRLQSCVAGWSACSGG